MSERISVVSHSPHPFFVTMLASVAAMAGFLFGFDTAVISGAVIAIQNYFQIGDWLVGLAVSLALLGSAIGAFFAGPIADRIGRVRSMQIAAVLFLVSAIGSGLPVTVWDFIWWRVLGGVAVGAASVIAPAYIAEVAPAHLRGRLGSLQQLAIVSGIFVAQLSNYFIAGRAGGAEPKWLGGFEAWKWMFWVEALPAVLYGVGAMFIPESPRYLVAKGDEVGATAILKRILGGDVAAKIVEIRESLKRTTRPSLKDIAGPAWGLLPIVWIGIILSMLQQLVGINVIFYYGATLWRIIGFTEADALKITMITGITNIVTTLIAIATVDKFGRKPLLLIGSIGMAVSLGTMAVLFGTATVDASGNPDLSKSAGLAALIAANAYVFFFGASWGPVVWVMLGEMFSNRIRGSALAVAAAMQWVANFAISTTFPPMAKGLGLGGSYLIYAFFAAVSFVFVWRVVSETKGKELEQVK